MSEQNHGLTHFDKDGKAAMVDVGGKAVSARRALAEGFITVSRPVMAAVLDGTAAKGDVLGVARVAGIMAAKRTSDLIPLCHPLFLTQCGVEFETDEAANTIRALCTVETAGQTGVEMEALTGVSVTLLTIYDMCKALDKGMMMHGIRLLEKDGGKSGSYRAEDRAP